MSKIGQSTHASGDESIDLPLHEGLTVNHRLVNNSQSQSRTVHSLEDPVDITQGVRSHESFVQSEKLENSVFRLSDPNLDANGNRNDEISTPGASVFEEPPDPDVEETTCPTTSRNTHKMDGWTAILYLSAFAIIGSSLRAFLGRIFGYDCEFPPEPSQRDYVYSMSTCVTSTGLTGRRGGSIFIDLPANLLGSLLMGILTPIDTENDIPSLPWLLPDHRWQKSDAIHLSLRTALCGSLTTFASWNSQMVVMMAGVKTMDNTPQVLQGIFGYLIGWTCAVTSFQAGRHLGKGVYFLRQKRKEENSGGDRHCSSPDNTDIESQATAVSRIKGFQFKLARRGFQPNFCRRARDIVDILVHGSYSPFIFTSALLTLFIVGDFKMDKNFHEKMWMSAIFAPIGTLLRWQLSFLNGSRFCDSDLLIHFPTGTFIANLLGCVISILAASLLSRLQLEGSADAWLYAIKVGLAGNLSTVSTLVKEVVLMSEKGNVGSAYFYAIATFATCCLVSLSLYLTIFKI